ncbi:hypothetical protein D3C85_1177360 [compost metagenome]
MEIDGDRTTRPGNSPDSLDLHDWRRSIEKDAAARLDVRCKGQEFSHTPNSIRVGEPEIDQEFHAVLRRHNERGFSPAHQSRTGISRHHQALAVGFRHCDEVFPPNRQLGSGGSLRHSPSPAPFGGRRHHEQPEFHDERSHT